MTSSTGVVLPAARRLRSTAKPSRPGRFASSTTRSKRSTRSRLLAVAPSVSWSTAWPSRVSRARIAAPISASSSTTRMRMVPFAMKGYGFPRGRDLSIFSDSPDNLCSAETSEDGINTRGDGNMQHLTRTASARPHPRRSAAHAGRSACDLRCTRSCA
ncbi:hypothetical protein BVIET440_30323 [Burkholderia vietnamiensis]|nr:hypothetical protein BVI434_2840005 [Burkholderia vietnamiensis]